MVAEGHTFGVITHILVDDMVILHQDKVHQSSDEGHTGKLGGHHFLNAHGKGNVFGAKAVHAAIGKGVIGEGAFVDLADMGENILFFDIQVGSVDAGKTGGIGIFERRKRNRIC